MNSINWKEQIGQRLMIGLQGKEIDSEFERLVKEYKIGNVILFQRNIESMAQVKKLCEGIQKLVKRETGYNALIAIDQEGGMVTRLPVDGCNVPGAMAVAATGCVENAEILARITARELKSVGINFNLAPVMDINNNPENPVIGVRSYGDTVETVEAFGTAAFRGYREGGILSCAKHFPGHGDTAVDSHIGLPVIEKSLEELEALELKPFRTIVKEGIPAVMTSHVLFPKLEPDHVPCTMSRRMITGILKEKAGFQGLVLSDCMEMDAIQKYYGTANGIVAAMAAGVDMVLVSHTPERMEEGVQAVYEAVEEGKLLKEDVRQSAEKIVRLKEEYFSGAGKDDFSVPGCTEEDREREKEIRRKSVVLLGKNQDALSLGQNPFFTGCAGYRASLVSNEEQAPETFAEYMAAKLGGTAFVTTKDPDEEEIAKAVELAGGASSIVVSIFNGKHHQGQQRLIRELSKAGVPVIVTALHNPYDLSGLPDTVSGIVAWDNSQMTLQILVELFRKEWQPTGRMPITL